MARRRYDDLVLAMCVLLPEVVSMDEETKGIADESTPFRLNNRFWVQCGLENSDNKIEMMVCGICFCGAGYIGFVWIWREGCEVEQCSEFSSENL